jgi:hypothetical protein
LGKTFRGRISTAGYNGLFYVEQYRNTHNSVGHAQSASRLASRHTCFLNNVLEGTDRLCSLAIKRVKRSWLQIERSGFDSRRYQILSEGVSLERGPLNLVSTVEELLERKSSCFGLETEITAVGDPSGGRSVGIVCSRTKTTELREFSAWGYNRATKSLGAISTEKQKQRNKQKHSEWSPSCSGRFTHWIGVGCYGNEKNHALVGNRTPAVWPIVRRYAGCTFPTTGGFQSK